MLNPSDISANGVKRIAGFEGTILHLYFDVAGISTVCTGHVTLPGEDWSTVTKEKCESTLGRDLGRFVRCVLEKVRAPYTQPMLDAAVSLAFNIGCGGFAMSSVLKFWNELKYEEAAASFKLWCNAQVKQKDGSFIKKPVLLGRRLAEGDLFSSGIAEVRNGKMDPEPSIEDAIKYAISTLFDLKKTLHDGPAGFDEEERRAPEDFLTDDGRIVVVPPSDEEDLAA